MKDRPPPLYTRTGDAGETGLPGGRRVEKASARIEALGAIDELNSIIGVVLAHGSPADVASCLQRIQRQLFALGADVAASEKGRIGEDEIRWLEQHIDAFSAAVPPLTAFILPGGSPAGAHCHLARSVCRRAERRLLQLGREAVVDGVQIKYLNRLSDLLFAAARRINHVADQVESPWKEEE